MQKSKIPPKDVEAGRCSKCYAGACEPIISSWYQSCVITIVKLVTFAVIVFLAYQIADYYVFKHFKQDQEEKSMLGFMEHLFHGSESAKNDGNNS